MRVTNSSFLMANHIPFLLQRRLVLDTAGIRANLSAFHERTAKIVDLVSMGLIFCPGAFIRTGAARFVASAFGRSTVSTLARTSVGRVALGIGEGLSVFLNTHRVGRLIALGAENNFAKSVLLGASHLYRNPTTILLPSGQSLYEMFLSDGKWKYTLLGGYILYRFSKWSLNRWPVGMDLGLKTAFALSAGHHQYRRMNLSGDYEDSLRTHSASAETESLYLNLRNMAGETGLFAFISGFAALSETPFGRRLGLDGTIGKSSCAIDDVLPGITSKLKEALEAGPLPHLASK